MSPGRRPSRSRMGIDGAAQRTNPKAAMIRPRTTIALPIDAITVEVILAQERRGTIGFCAVNTNELIAEEEKGYVSTILSRQCLRARYGTVDPFLRGSRPQEEQCLHLG